MDLRCHIWVIAQMGPWVKTSELEAILGLLCYNWFNNYSITSDLWTLMQFSYSRVLLCSKFEEDFPEKGINNTIDEIEGYTIE